MATRGFAVVLLALLIAVCLPVSAADAPVKKPLGTWERKAGDSTLEFKIQADGLRFKISNGGNVVEIQADYGITKTGVLFGVVNKAKAEGGGDAPAEGHLFSFQFTVDKDALTIKELRGTDNAEAKQLVEGEYKKTDK